MNDRQKQILAAVIEEYTETAIPVGSQILVGKYNFSVSPATIRNDMNFLENEGFLYQPHVSAGRIPTDEGYRYFVESIMEDRELSRSEQRRLQTELLKLQAKNARLSRTSAKLLSVLSGNLAISGMPGTDEYYEFGLRKVIEEVREQNTDELCQLAEVLDYIDERCDQILLHMKDDETQIYIGKENPIPGISGYSMVVSPYKNISGERGLIAIIGPKRMKYAKNKSLIDYVKKFLSSSHLIIIFIFVSNVIIFI